MGTGAEVVHATRDLVDVNLDGTALQCTRLGRETRGAWTLKVDARDQSMRAREFSPFLHRESDPTQIPSSVGPKNVGALSKGLSFPCR